MTRRSRDNPLIGIVTSTEFIRPQRYQVAGEHYIEAISVSAKGTPFLIPSTDKLFSADEILSHVDGILFPGAHSNVAPESYGQSQEQDGAAFDPQREATTLPLFRQAAETGVPFLAICLGFQEMNVAFGGSLHQELHKMPGKLDHREDEEAELATRFAPVHDISVTRDGTLDRLIGQGPFRVNSLHGQGVDNLGNALSVEAVAEDGTIEAAVVAAAETFSLGVQWHPEWQATENPQSDAIFHAFGLACRARMQN